MSTISASGYFSAVYAFCTSIHALRFAAVSPQDTIAYLPEPPIASSSASVSPWPMPSTDAWLTNTSRTELGASVSLVATAMPASAASCEQRRHRVGVVRRDDERVDTLLDERADDVRLGRGIGCRRALVEPFDSRVPPPRPCRRRSSPRSRGCPASLGTNAMVRSSALAPPLAPPLAPGAAVSPPVSLRDVQPARTTAAAAESASAPAILREIFIDAPSGWGDGWFPSAPGPAPCRSSDRRAWARA